MSLTPREPSAYDNEYPCHLGELVANLALLEFALRVTLYLLDTTPEKRLPLTFRIAELPEGQEVADTWLTNRRYFKELVDEYNRRCRALGRPGIDPSIGDLRNDLAHGSMTAPSPETPMSLLRYEPAGKGKRTGGQKCLVTLAWPKDQSGRVARAVTSVLPHLDELRDAGAPDGMP